MQASDTAARKAELRKKLRSLRRSLAPDAVSTASEKVCRLLVALSEFENSKLILAYMAANGEIDVFPAVKAAHEAGKSVAFPLCVENGGLTLLVPKDESAFKPGSYGILEPDPERSFEVSAKELDLMIVPGVAFDAECARLGQGGGYYDRLLENTEAFTVGVGHDFQLVDDLPLEPHDLPLDAVVFPSRVLRRRCSDKFGI